MITHYNKKLSKLYKKRLQLIIEKRKAGLTFLDIGEALGISKQRVHALFTKSVRDTKCKSNGHDA